MPATASVTQKESQDRDRATPQEPKIPPISDRRRDELELQALLAEPESNFVRVKRPLERPARGGTLPPTHDPENVRDVVIQVLSAFEGGAVHNFAALNRSKTDPGGLSYGFFQANHRDGILEKVVRRYLDLVGEENIESNPTAKGLRDALPKIQNTTREGMDALRADTDLHGLLKAAAKDPLMQQAQHQICEELYYKPIEPIAKKFGMDPLSPLARLIFFDSHIQGGLARTLGKTNKALKEAGVMEPTEEQFLTEYLKQRRMYLKNIGLATTSYRVDELERLLTERNFNLEGPLTIRGRNIDGLPMPVA